MLITNDLNQWQYKMFQVVRLFFDNDIIPTEIVQFLSISPKIGSINYAHGKASILNIKLSWDNSNCLCFF